MLEHSLTLLETQVLLRRPQLPLAMTQLRQPLLVYVLLELLAPQMVPTKLAQQLMSQLASVKLS
jgi:hypothetical protein